MHELFIAESILTFTRKALPAKIRPASVQQVQVQVGKLDAVVPETLYFAFDAIKGSFGMTQANLSIETIEVLCRCEECRHEFGIDLPLFMCPACRGSHIKVLRGRGIKLTRIIAEKADEIDNGNTYCS